MLVMEICTPAALALGGNGERLIPISVANSTDGASLSGNDFSSAFDLTPDGRYVVFVSAANDLVTNDTASGAAGGFLDVFVRDRESNQTILVSVARDGMTGGHGHSNSAGISADGRYVVFQSAANDLTVDDNNNAEDVFIRDLVAGTTSAISLSTDGVTTGNASSVNPSMTRDGRFVLFDSAASDLVAGDTNGITDVFLRDLQANTTLLISTNASPAGAWGGSSEAAGISTNGERIVFLSTATNLVAGVTNITPEVYVREWTSGTTYWASRDAAVLTGQPANRLSTGDAMISADGRYVVFSVPVGTSSSSAVLRHEVETGTTELVATNSVVGGSAEGGRASISADGRFVVYEALLNLPFINESALYRWDGLTKTKELVTPDHSGAGVAGGLSFTPEISPDGRFVSFLSTSSNLVAGSGQDVIQAYVRDLDSGTNLLVSVASNGDAITDVLESVLMTEDARWVAFTTAEPALGDADKNGTYDVYLRDVEAGITDLVSRRASAVTEAMAGGWSSLSRETLSSDGRYLTFKSSADNLVTGDSNGVQDIFRHDLDQGITLLVSANTNGVAANRASTDPTTSTNGHFVAFVSAASDLASNDTNLVNDLFVRDMIAGTTVLVSRNLAGMAAGIDSAFPVALSGDGQVAVFASAAGGLVPGDIGGRTRVFWHDLRSKTTVRVSPLTERFSGWFACSADGQTVVYQASSSFNGVTLWDAATQTVKPLVESAQGTFGGQLSANGRVLLYFVRFANGYELRVRDVQSGIEYVIGPAAFSNANPPALSPDGRWVAYVTSNSPLSPDDTNSATDVALFDWESQEHTIVSRRSSGAGTGNGASTMPGISADGRWIVFRSSASDLVDRDDNGQPDVFLFDRQSGTVELLSESVAGSSGRGMSSLPIISFDGTTIAFQSFADDLVGGDRNEANDVFALRRAGAPALRISRMSLSADGAVVIEWSAISGQSCQIEYKDDLTAESWSISPIMPTFTDGTARFIDPSAASASSSRYYRLRASGP